MLLPVCTAYEEYIKVASLIYMRHGPLATDAGVILQTHNYMHQQHLFCMDDSQLQIQITPLCLLSDTKSTNSTHTPCISIWHRTNLFHRPYPVSVSFLIFLPFSHILSGVCQLPCTYPPTLHISSFPPPILPLECSSFLLSPSHLILPRSLWV